MGERLIDGVREPADTEHRHGGISMLTPEQVHFGFADQVIARRKAVLREAWAAHPDRFVSGEPKPKPLPGAVWINHSKPHPHYTGDCSLIDSPKCLIRVDRLRNAGGIAQARVIQDSHRQRRGRPY